MENVCSLVHDLLLKGRWIMRYYNNPKHTIKYIFERCRRNKIKILEWPGKSTDFNLFEMRWQDVKQSSYLKTFHCC